jgi:hypothetical protein
MELAVAQTALTKTWVLEKLRLMPLAIANLELQRGMPRKLARDFLNCAPLFGNPKR